MRSLEAIAFALAQAWFGCRISSIVKAEIEQLPPAVALWFTHFGMSIADASVAPNKNELWLHLSLLGSCKDRFAVAARRLMPLRRSRGILNPLVPDEGLTWKFRAERRWFGIRFTIGRLIHHFRAAVPTALTGVKWLAVRKGIAPQFLVFLLSASLFNFGLTIFYLLYNLLLLERGFHEDLLGAISSAMSAGSIAGTIPAAFVLRRFGIRTTIAGAFVSIAFISLIRATVFHPALLVASAFAGGFCFASYAVTIAPAVAQWTTERARPLGFSLVFSLGIGIGVLGNVVGGRLPGLFERSSLQAALLVGIAIAALGALPALLLRTSAPMSESHSRVYPRGVFIVSFLGAILIWNLATSMINPFLSAYFVRIAGLTTPQIGVLFSFGQAAQVVAVLAAPFMLKRLGVIPGIIGMQVATAVSALIFALQPTGWLVALPFAAFMAFQYMSEPGMNSLLMSEVAETQRSGASALNFFVIFTGQAIGAAIAGVAARRFGYPVVFSIATFLAIVAAFAFRYVAATKSSTS
ncbi:MAG TPA: MFS transporter [Bryobacteraceae bacterium]|nr:MFS transporter [Bryobacteraceae bacterium]